MASLGAGFISGLLLFLAGSCSAPFAGSQDRQQPQKPGLGHVINPKTIMEASESLQIFMFLTLIFKAASFCRTIMQALSQPPCPLLLQ